MEASLFVHDKDWNEAKGEVEMLCLEGLQAQVLFHPLRAQLLRLETFQQQTQRLAHQQCLKERLKRRATRAGIEGRQL